MKKKVITLILSLCTVMALGGCDGDTEKESKKEKSEESISPEEEKSEKSISPEEKIVCEALDDYFKKYENCDVDGLNDVPMNKYYIDKALYESKSDMLEFDQVDELRFMRIANIPTPLSELRDADYLKFDGLDDFNNLVKEYYSSVELKFDYEIIEIYEPDELTSISYKAGMGDIVQVEPETRMEDWFQDKEIEEWYAVTAKVTWYVNGDKYGLNDDLLDDMDTIFERTMPGESYMKKFDIMLESGLDELNFVIVKYEDKWYVCPSSAFKAQYAKSIIFE